MFRNGKILTLLQQLQHKQLVQVAMLVWKVTACQYRSLTWFGHVYSKYITFFFFFFSHSLDSALSGSIRKLNNLLPIAAAADLHLKLVLSEQVDTALDSLPALESDLSWDIAIQAYVDQ